MRRKIGFDYCLQIFDSDPGQSFDRGRDGTDLRRRCALAGCLNQHQFQTANRLRAANFAQGLSRRTTRGFGREVFQPNQIKKRRVSSRQFCQGDDRAHGSRPLNPGERDQRILPFRRPNVSESGGGLHGKIDLLRVGTNDGSFLQGLPDCRDCPRVPEVPECFDRAGAHPQRVWLSGVRIVQRDQRNKRVSQVRSLADAGAARGMGANIRVVTPEESQEGGPGLPRAETIETVGAAPLDFGVRRLRKLL